MSDLLKLLWSSTHSLHVRFGVEPTLRARVDKFFEEVEEFSEKANPSADTDELTEELVDVIVTGIGVLMARGIGYTKLASAVRRVIAKNDAKTGQTHKVKNGKIVRR